MRNISIQKRNSYRSGVRCVHRAFAPNNDRPSLLPFFCVLMADPLLTPGVCATQLLVLFCCQEGTNRTRFANAKHHQYVQKPIYLRGNSSTHTMKSASGKPGSGLGSHRAAPPTPGQHTAVSAAGVQCSGVGAETEPRGKTTGIVEPEL